jgi:hypothetical protein
VNDLNTIVAWAGMTCGVVSGAIVGLRFSSEQWLGGYASWPRRMIRLGHIAVFGMGFLNLAYATTVGPLGWHGTTVMSVSLALANLAMPAICFLSAWRKPLKALFFIPVLLIVFPTAGLLWMRMSL